MSSLIKLENIHKHYTTPAGKVPVLQNIALTVKAGEALAVTGSSGSGKSTLMNIIGLLDDFSSGHYCLQGEEVKGFTADQCAERRNRIMGFVFQSFHLLPRLTALENVMLPLLYRKDKKGDAAQKARLFLDRTGMTPWMYRFPAALSGGQQQRVAIARALAGDPAIILADEPTGALDSHNARLIMDLLFELNQTAGTTLLIVTHDPAVYSRFPRRLTLQDGSIKT